MRESAWADMWLRMRFRADLFLRKLVLPLRVGRADISDMLAWAEPGEARPYRRLDSAYILRRVRKSVRRPIVMRNRRCLREGLLAYHFLRSAGYRPDLVFGVDPASLDGAKPAAHCWIRLDGRDVFNPPEQPLTVVLRHAPQS